MGGGLANEARNIPSMVQEIHVLLVDHDAQSLINTTKMLEMCSYRVTLVELASAAISMLSSGKGSRFDIVMADVNSPDCEAFKLLYHAVNMDLPVVFMSADDNTYLAMRALENGAFLFIKKPAAMEILHCLWQHVYREENEGFRSGMDDRKNPKHILGGKGKSKRERGDEKWHHRDDTSISNKGVKRKVCTEWTEELHAKFVEAVTQLGEGRCFPKEIVEFMDIPGLTRMQVASHLQKCRNNSWQTPGERRSHLTSPGMFRDLNGSPYKPRKFGSMPQIGRAGHTSPRPVQDSFENVVGYVPSIMTHAASNTNQASMLLDPGPSNTHSSDAFFISQDHARPIRNISSGPQKETSCPVPSPCQHDDQAYPRENSAVASVDSQWSSETSNVESDG